MICEKIIGTADEPRFADLLHEKVEVEWYNVDLDWIAVAPKQVRGGNSISGDDLKRGWDMVTICRWTPLPRGLCSALPSNEATVERDHRLAWSSAMKLAIPTLNWFAKMIYKILCCIYTLYQDLAESLKRTKAFSGDCRPSLDLADALPASAFAID